MRANLEKERHHRKQLTAAANHKSPTIANVKGKSSPRVSEDPSLPKEPRTISLKIPANNGKPDVEKDTSYLKADLGEASFRA